MSNEREPRPGDIEAARVKQIYTRTRQDLEKGELPREKIIARTATQVRSGEPAGEPRLN